MTREELTEAVVVALKETQRLSGHDGSETITETTIPIRDLKQFASPNGVEATMALEEQLRCDLPVNLFTDEATRRPLMVREVVDRILARQAPQGDLE